jgi:hypothetical protein
MTRSRIAILASLGALALQATGAAVATGAKRRAARAATTAPVAVEPFVSKLAAYGGVLAWSHWDAALKGFRLMIHTGAGNQLLPVAPRTVPFDVDLGPDARGRVVAVYSRCAQEQPVWTLGPSIVRVRAPRGCVLYRYDFATAREQRIPRIAGAGSFYLPTIWSNEIAYVRAHGGRAPMLFAQPLRAARGKPIRAVALPGGPSIEAGGAGPVSLDLRAGKLAFAWHAGAPEVGSEIAVDTLPAPATRQGERPQGISYTTYDAESADARAPGLLDFPTLTGDGLFYGRFDGSSIAPPGDAFEQIQPGADGPLLAPAPHALRGQARDGGATYALLGPYAGSFSNCGPSGCQLVVIRGLTYG